MKFVWILNGSVAEVMLISVASEIVCHHSLECCLMCLDYRPSVPETDDNAQSLSWLLSCCAAWMLWWWKFRSPWMIHHALQSDMHTAWTWLWSVLHGLLWQTLELGPYSSCAWGSECHYVASCIWWILPHACLSHQQILFGELTYWLNSCGTRHCYSVCFLYEWEALQNTYSFTVQWSMINRSAESLL
jgi:hypothetical protein